MKKLSDRGIGTVIVMVALVIGTIAVILINNIQDVHSQQWKIENGVTVEKRE